MGFPVGVIPVPGTTGVVEGPLCDEGMLCDRNDKVGVLRSGEVYNTSPWIHRIENHKKGISLLAPTKLSGNNFWSPCHDPYLPFDVSIYSNIRLKSVSLGMD